MSATSEEKDSILNYPAWLMTLGSLITLGFAWGFLWILSRYWGEYVLLSFDDLRAHGTSMAEGLKKVWFIFAWAAATSLAVGIYRRDRPRNSEPGTVLAKGWWASLNAGVFEELVFRWLAFFIAMVLTPFFNVITFGLYGWVHREILVPVANFATLGALEPQFNHPNWVFGASILVAAAWFRAGHAYLGVVGWVNSWFMGMVMFWLMFNYGIGSAIVAHIVYDMIVFGIGALACSWQPPARRRLYG